MSKRLKRIVIDTEPRLATVIAQLLIDRSVNFSIRDVEIIDGKVSTVSAAKAPHDDKPMTSDKAARVAEAVLASMQPGESYHYKHFGPLLERHGFSAASVSPLLSQLGREGKVHKGKRGYWIKEESANG